MAFPREACTSLPRLPILTKILTQITFGEFSQYLLVICVLVFIMLTSSCSTNRILLSKPHRRGTPPLPRPLSARCAVPGGALGPGLGCVRLEKDELLEYLVVLKSTYRLALGVPDGLIHRNDQTRGLHCAADCIGLDQTRLPDERIQVVSDTIGTIDIDANPCLSTRMFHAELV